MTPLFSIWLLTGSRLFLYSMRDQAKRREALKGVVVLLGRFLFVLIFLMFGPRHFSPQTIGYAASQGVPLASILVPLSGVLALVGGLSILLGYAQRGSKGPGDVAQGRRRIVPFCDWFSAFTSCSSLIDGRGFTVRPFLPPGLLMFPILSLILLIIAGFLVSFGRNATKTAWFSLAFLVFAVPWPEVFLNGIIHLLQSGSAAVAGWIFDASGIPVLRDRFFFYLPGLSIEVAKECSGIRSSIALVILALLISHFSFSKFWKKFIFVFSGLLMMLVKNGVRIATLTVLAKYVDPGFLFGRLHREGGVVFFLFGLALLVPVFHLLRRGEAPIPQVRSTPAESQNRA